jgi:sulfur-oxidizing protein SoxY
MHGVPTNRITGARRPARRDLLAGAASAVAIALVARPASAALAPRTEAAIAKVLAGREAAEGGIALSLPTVAENGAIVPMTVAVESPMTPEDHVTAVHVFADRNPDAEVVVFRFTPAIGRAEATTRIRLSEGQTVIAVAETSAGAVYLARREVAVTVGGCGG